MCYVVGGECQKCVEGQTGAGGVVVKNMWYSIILKIFYGATHNPQTWCVYAHVLLTYTSKWNYK